MDHRERQNTRLYLLGAFLAVVLLIYLGVLYNTQVNDHDYYLAQSIRTITREETVEASRGVITDRNGQVLVSNRSTYNLTFDTSLLKEGEDTNRAILRLLELCQDQGVAWVDNLPLSQTAPFSYTLESVSALQRGRFLTYLKSLSGVEDALEAYLLQHPEALRTTDDEGAAVDLAEPILADVSLTEQARGAALLEAFPAENLTGQLLIDAGITAHQLVEQMREVLDLPPVFSLNQARMVLGVRYELNLRRLDNYDAYVMAEDIDTAFISLLSDGSFSGAKVTSSSVREYETTYAAHILGYVTSLFRDRDDIEDLLSKGYNTNDKIGREGAELAFESYLKGTDGTRIVSTNSDGKITGEYWYQEPEPGSTVELTIDLDLQKTMEDALAATVTAMNADDHDETRGAGAVLLSVDGAEVLAMASYPTYDLATFRQAANYSVLSTDPSAPLLNRATSGGYAPGSTFKPLTAVAALEEGVVSLTERVNCAGRWWYPDIIEGTQAFGYNCWRLSGHGRLTVSGAINNSCNCFFCEMGYRLGIDLLDQYANAFGLGQKTGIEIGEISGTLAGPASREAAGGVWYGGDTVQAAYGQSDHLFTPLQLANYIATLANGGDHYETHLLKAVKSYDNAQVLAVGGGNPVNTVDMRDTTLSAVKAGMYDLTTVGSLAGYFRNCVVDVGAKTGTAQLGVGRTNNGVFVCFAPFDEPEVALAIVIEHGGSGAALASTAVQILNAYFTAEETGTAISGEHQLLQ